MAQAVSAADVTRSLLCEFRVGSIVINGASAKPLIFPRGQITRCCVQPVLQKYFCFLLTQITCLLLAIPSRDEGTLAIVTDVGAGSGGREGCD